MAQSFNPSPSFPFLAGLFGQNTVYRQRHHAYQLAGPSSDSGLFGPTAMADISGFLNLNGSNQFSSALGNIGRSGDFSQLPDELRAPYQQATGSLDEFIGKSRPVVSSMIETGNPTDIGSLVAAAQSRYNNQFLPQAAEQYNPSTGTGFANIAAREANLMGVELGQLDFAAQEAAKQRQLTGISVAAPALASLNSARLSLPNAILGELQGMSQSSDSGGRLLAALQSLLGTAEQQSSLKTPIDNPGSSPSGGSGWMSAIGGLLGGVGSLVGLCWVADELFGIDDPRAHHARLWCALHSDHPFVQQYAREGRDWAAWLHEHPWARPLVEPVWAWMAFEGARIARQLN